MLLNDADVIRRLNLINRKLDLIMTHLGLSLSAPAELAGKQPSHTEIVQHLVNGRKILAIKVYREATGAGLAEAKAAVEKIARDLGLD